MPVLATCNSKN